MARPNCDEVNKCMWPGCGECGGTVCGQVVVSVEELHVARSW